MFNFGQLLASSTLWFKANCVRMQSNLTQQSVTEKTASVAWLWVRPLSVVWLVLYQATCELLKSTNLPACLRSPMFTVQELWWWEGEGVCGPAFYIYRLLFYEILMVRFEHDGLIKRPLKHSGWRLMEVTVLGVCSCVLAFDVSTSWNLEFWTPRHDLAKS